MSSAKVVVLGLQIIIITKLNTRVTAMVEQVEARVSI